MNTISLSVAKERLMKLWVIGFTFVFLFFLFQTITARYVGIVNEAWGWLLPHFLPTLAIIIGGYFFDVDRKNISINIIPGTAFKIAYGISILYFFTISIVVFSYRNTDGNILDYYQSFNIILSSIQTLISGTVVFLFSKQKARRESP